MTATTPDEEAPAQLQLDEGGENHLAAGLAKKATGSGLRRARDGADDWWWSPAWRAVGWLADTQTNFTAWDVTQLGVPDPDHPARWGALFRAAATAGVIEPVGYAPSQRPARAGGVCRVWRGRAPTP